jgi:DNA-directed RNA polymerase subunit RPC12/RpoP
VKKTDRKTQSDVDAMLTKASAHGMCLTLGTTVDRPMPEGYRCPRCGAKMNGEWIAIPLPIARPTSVKCTKCPYRNSFYGDLGERLCGVEELPQGAYAHYESSHLKEKFHRSSKPKPRKRRKHP